MHLLLSPETIQSHIRKTARRISDDYRQTPPLVIGVLTGGFVLCADLFRLLDADPVIDFVQVSSYGSGDSSSGRCTLIKDTDRPVAGKDVLIVEDIIDTGHTARFLQEHFAHKKAASIKICSLIDKPSRRTQQVTIDYPLFHINENVFLVGFGLDYNGLYRCLPGVYALSEEERVMIRNQ